MAPGADAKAAATSAPCWAAPLEGEGGAAGAALTAYRALLQEQGAAAAAKVGRTSPWVAHSRSLKGRASAQLVRPPVYERASVCRTRAVDHLHASLSALAIAEHRALVTADPSELAACQQAAGKAAEAAEALQRLDARCEALTWAAPQARREELRAAALKASAGAARCAARAAVVSVPCPTEHDLMVVRRAPEVGPAPLMGGAADALLGSASPARTMALVMRELARRRRRAAAA